VIIGRRELLKGLGAATLVLPWLRREAYAAPAQAQRFIVLYFPDGVLGPSQAGEPSRWHCTGGELDFTLSPQLQPLTSHRGDCIFFNGLSMGPTDSGSHPGGAKKLLTGRDGGNGESIDHFLSRSAGAQAPWQHLYLGAMANQNNASGDKHIVYPTAGQTIPPEDDPKRAFSRLFASVSTMPGMPPPNNDAKLSVLDGVLADLNALRARVSGSERAKIDLHLDAVREVENRVKTMGSVPMMPQSCGAPLSLSAVDEAQLYEPAKFGDIARAQIDVMVTAMACGLTQVGTLQLSQHTSELLMSRMPGTEMFDPSFDMRSHQASHYGDRQDFTKREVKAFDQQIRWFVSQFGYLLDQLKARPEPSGGTMLDTSVVLLCSEICDGNTHSHDNMPFVLGGKGSGRLRTGRLVQPSYARHGDLLAAIATSMGQPVQGWGDASGGPLGGVLS
jgi:hypothetical protein